MAARKKSAAKATARAPSSVRSRAPARASTDGKSTRKPEKAPAEPPARKRHAAVAAAPSADAARISERLQQAIPEPRCELAFENAFQLLIATILSAQSTDKTVNAVTPALFARYPTPKALAASDPDEVETLIKRTGFFRAKTKSIRETAEKLEREFDGEVPRTLEALVGLKGVARKTANVVLGTAYGIASGFVVDTHVARVANRLALSQESDPAKIERDLCAQFPREQWVDMGHSILLHGRYTCLAKAPMCEVCPLNELCPSRNGDAGETWQARAKAEAGRMPAREGGRH
jgi:endonuclease-3